MKYLNEVSTPELIKLIKQNLATKQDKVTNATDKLASFDSSGQVENSTIDKTDVSDIIDEYKTIEETKEDQEFNYRQVPVNYGGGATINTIKGNTMVWNQLVDSSTSSLTLTSGHKFIMKIGTTFSYVTGTGQSQSVTGGSDMVIDLTMAFGSGNEPADVNAFRELFPLDYYNYNVGSLLNFKGTSLVSSNSSETKSDKATIPSTTYFPTGMKSAGSTNITRDTLTSTEATIKVEERNYWAGDESDTSVTTNGIRTNYAIPSPIILDINDLTQKIYSAKRSLTSATWTRTEDATGLIANATKDGSTVVNNFDLIYPWSDIITVNLSNSGSINASYGDNSFKFDGTNGDLMTYVPGFYLQHYYDTSYEYARISKKPFIGAEYIPPFYLGRYNTEDNTTSNPRSRSGAFNAGVINISSFRTQAAAKGTSWSQLDWHYFILQLLYQIEYCNNDSQSILGSGVSSLTNNSAYKATVAETGATRIIVANSTANNFSVGQSIHLTTNGWNWDIAKYRTITAIADYDSSNKAISFDGSAVNITTSVYIIHSAVKSGECDTLGMKSGCLTNDGKHSMIYRGIENIFGNQWTFLDGLNIKDNVAWICYDHTKYVSDKFESPYFQLGYTNATSNGNPSRMGYDSNHPFIGLPSEVGTSYYGDYYWQNTGNRIARVGGPWPAGSRAGLFSFHLSIASGHADSSLGSRLLYNIRQ